MIKKLILVSMATIFLGACGGSASSSGGSNESISEEDDSFFDDGDESDSSSYVINNFEVVGTSADNDSEQAPINPAVKSGNFVISWTLEDSSEQHFLSASVSLNDVLSDSDIEFYDELCNEATSCGQSETYSLDCFFNNSNELFCADNAGDTADLSVFFDALPKDAYIILESCDSSLLSCDTEAHAVQFQ